MRFETVEQHNKEINERGFVGYEGKLVITFRDRKKSHIHNTLWRIWRAFTRSTFLNFSTRA